MPIHQKTLGSGSDGEPEEEEVMLSVIRKAAMDQLDYYIQNVVPVGSLKNSVTFGLDMDESKVLVPEMFIRVQCDAQRAAYSGLCLYSQQRGDVAIDPGIVERVIVGLEDYGNPQQGKAPRYTNAALREFFIDHYFDPPLQELLESAEARTDEAKWDVRTNIAGMAAALRDRLLHASLDDYKDFSGGTMPVPSAGEKLTASEKRETELALELLKQILLSFVSKANPDYKAFIDTLPLTAAPIIMPVFRESGALGLCVQIRSETKGDSEGPLDAEAAYTLRASTVASCLNTLQSWEEIRLRHVVANEVFQQLMTKMKSNKKTKLTPQVIGEFTTHIRNGTLPLE